MRKAGVLGCVALSGALLAAGCDSFSQAMTAHTDVVARAGSHELKVEQVAGWMAENPRLPAEPEVIEAVANLWVDYILLATEAARDSTLAMVDLDVLIRPQVDQEVVWKLRDKVIQVDTILSDDELRAVYDREQPGVSVRARHILIRLQPDAPPAQRDSVVRLLRNLRSRTLAGEDFGALATEYSQDTGTAPNGGDLDFFERGQMVQPFEEAAFALGVGEVSDIVETPFGLHLVKVEEKQVPSFDDLKESYRIHLREQRMLEAEDSYIAQLTEPLGMRVQDGAYDVVRELARKPQMQLSGRAAARPLVTYRGGAYTAGKFLDLMRRSSPNQRMQISAVGDDQLESVLKGLTQNEILVAEAERLGMALTPAERDSLADNTRRQVEAAAAAAGLKSVRPQAGESMTQAIDRQVATLMRDIVRGDTNVIPLGPVTFSLRERYGASVSERSFQAVAAKIEAARPSMEFAPSGMEVPPAAR